MRGELIHDRVVDDPGPALARGLDRDLTGYAVIEPAGTLLLDEDDRGILTLQDGVPIAAHHDGTGASGAAAVAELAGRGPYRVALFALASAPDAPPGGALAPEVPAEVLASDPDLADRTAAAAPADAAEPVEAPDALAAFLDNESKIERIQRQAREEASRRADEWGLDAALDRAEQATDS